MAQKVSLSITSRDTNGETVTTNVSNVNPALFPATEETYAFIDAAARALNNLTANTYVDTVVTFSESVNEQLD